VKINKTFIKELREKKSKIKRINIKLKIKIYKELKLNDLIEDFTKKLRTKIRD
jgi:FKBP-type peptidyl-prolyl cis-trans isomerase (trigger factor)